MKTQKELYQKRGKINSIVLIVFFLVGWGSLYSGVSLFLDSEYLERFPSNTNALYLSIGFNSAFLVMLIGLWYLKKWAAGGLTIIFVLGSMGLSLTEGKTEWSLLQAILYGIFSTLCGLALLWGLFLGRYWERLE